jgi:hypothetical protein
MTPVNFPIGKARCFPGGFPCPTITLVCSLYNLTPVRHLSSLTPVRIVLIVLLTQSITLRRKSSWSPWTLRQRTLFPRKSRPKKANGSQCSPSVSAGGVPAGMLSTTLPISLGFTVVPHSHSLSLVLFRGSPTSLTFQFTPYGRFSVRDTLCSVFLTR